MIPPVLVRPEAMDGTGFLGAHAAEVYRLRDDDLYLVGTSEVALAGYHAGEIVDLSGGPLRYAGWSSCFRREAGSYGKDIRGIIRVHQLDKVEIFVYTRPEDAEAEPGPTKLISAGGLNCGFHSWEEVASTPGDAQCYVR
jgi:seryl-tRNA synthetase